MSWREMLGSSAQPVPSTQNVQYSQKLDQPILSADCADIAQEENNSKLLEVLSGACRGLEIDPVDVLNELSEEDIEAWELGEVSIDLLTAFADALVDRRMMDQGKRPAHFTERAECHQCGPIYLWSNEKVRGCPWCHNRNNGLPIPRPGSVRCGHCIHFEQVDYHPHLGHCAKGEPEAVAGLWDSDRRYCLFFVPVQSCAAEANQNSREPK